MRLLTNSRINTYQRCQHADWIQYQLRVRLSGVVPLRVGTEVHEGLDLLKQGKPLDEVLSVMAQRYLNMSTTVPDWKRDSLLIEHEKVRAMLTEYVWFWAKSDLTVLATEQLFEVPITNPASGRRSRTWEYGGKIDGIVRTPEGEVCILEHKTTKRDISERGDYWSSLTMNSQVTLYMMAARKLGFECTGIIYDVLRVPGQERASIPLLDEEDKKQVLDPSGERVFLESGKPRQTGDRERGWEVLKRDETSAEYNIRVTNLIRSHPDDYYKRVFVPRLEADLEEMRRDLWAVAGEVRRGEQLGHHPRSRSHCLLPAACPNLIFCSGGEDPRLDPLPDNFVRLETEHPELSGESDA